MLFRSDRQMGVEQEVEVLRRRFRQRRGLGFELADLAQGFRDRGLEALALGLDLAGDDDVFRDLLEAALDHMGRADGDARERKGGG